MTSNKNKWFPIYDDNGQRSLTRGRIIAYELPDGTWQTPGEYKTMLIPKPPKVQQPGTTWRKSDTIALALVIVFALVVFTLTI